VEREVKTRKREEGEERGGGGEGDERKETSTVVRIPRDVVK